MRALDFLNYSSFQGFLKHTRGSWKLLVNILSRHCRYYRQGEKVYHGMPGKKKIMILMSMLPRNGQRSLELSCLVAYLTTRKKRFFVK